jgi:hypothetical protein
VHQLLEEHPEGKTHLIYVGVHGIIVLQLIFKSYSDKIQAKVIWLEVGTIGGRL